MVVRALNCFALIALLTAFSAARPQASPQAQVPVESEHRAGSRDMEGWTLNSTIPDQPQGKFAFTLVLARKGRVLREIKGEPIIWDWIFWDEGRRVAYETGPLHFAMQCKLVDIASGREVASIDCFHGLPDNPPAWLDALENRR